MIRRILILCVAGAIGIVAGCTQENNTGNGSALPPAKPSAGGEKFYLPAEPKGAINVLDLRKNARDGDEVVVVGRIGGTEAPWTEGKAKFCIADLSFTPCNERPNDPCPTPWDYCCQAGLNEGIVQIEFIDDAGKCVATDARTLFGVKELNTIVVKGKVSRDDKGGKFVVQATGLYRRDDAKK